MGLRCFHTSIFIETHSLEGLPTKAKEDTSPHEMRLSPTGHQPSISWFRGKTVEILFCYLNKTKKCKTDKILLINFEKVWKGYKRLSNQSLNFKTNVKPLTFVKFLSDSMLEIVCCNFFRNYKSLSTYLLFGRTLKKMWLKSNNSKMLISLI